MTQRQFASNCFWYKSVFPVNQLNENEDLSGAQKEVPQELLLKAEKDSQDKCQNNMYTKSTCFLDTELVLTFIKTRPALDLTGGRGFIYQTWFTFKGLGQN